MNCLSQCPIAVKSRHKHGYFYNRKHLIGLSYSFRGLVVDYSHDREHDNIQRDKVQEKLKGLHPGLQVQGLAWASEISNPIDVLPPTRPCLI